MVRIHDKLKNKYKVFNIQTMNLKIGHRLFFCFLGGIIIGTLILNFWLTDYASKLGIYSEYFINGVNLYDNNIDKLSFFVYCTKKYIMELALILFMNITPVSRMFNYGYCVYKGIVISLLISSATLVYGAGGLFLYVASIFPQYIIYIPLVVVAFYVGIRLGESFKEKKSKRVKLKEVAVLLVLVLATAFLEAFVNYPILKIMFS